MLTSVTQRLKPGQIRYLYLWVHPQWSSPWTNEGSNQEIQEYRQFVQRLQKAPRAGLVQVADNPREEFAHQPAYTYFTRELERFNQEAQEKLGERYVVWNKGRFVNCKKQDHIDTLVRGFNLVENQQDTFVQEHERYLTTTPKHLAKISVFGKERDTCPLGQATLFNLHSLCSIVRYYSQETPRRITPPTPHFLFPVEDATYIFEKQ